MPTLRDVHVNRPMPYQSEHAARLKPPKSYTEFRRQNDKLGPGIHAIFGLKGGQAELQAVRFDRDRFSPEQARKWLAAHKMKTIAFEVAKAAHRRDTCMQCKNAAPAVDVLWNGSKSRAWLCDRCFAKWAGDKAEQINSIARIDGRAPAHRKQVKRTQRYFLVGKQFVVSGPDLIRAYKHLQGKHDQKTHARGGGVSGVRTRAGELRQAITDSGGFSYSVVDGSSPTSGYALSIHGDRERKISIDKLTKDDIIKYVKDNKDLLTGPDTEAIFGAWHDTSSGTVYLDVSTVKPKSKFKEAIQLAKEHKQLAVFDLSEFKEINTEQALAEMEKRMPKMEYMLSKPPEDEDQLVVWAEKIVAKLKGQQVTKATTKTEQDGQHPASHYLVVEDPEKTTTWHLRVRNVEGELDHRLMGAAWAALHGGYRGNKYEGPDKQKALAALEALYKREDMETPVSKEFAVQIRKMDDEKRLIYGVVLRPDLVDAQGDVITPEEVEKAAHNFMLESQQYDYQHQTVIPADKIRPVESFIAQADFSLGSGKVLKGDWVLVSKVLDDELWQQVKSGEFLAYSIKGRGQRALAT